MSLSDEIGVIEIIIPQRGEPVLIPARGFKFETDDDLLTVKIVVPETIKAEQVATWLGRRDLKSKSSVGFFRGGEIKYNVDIPANYHVDVLS